MVTTLLAVVILGYLPGALLFRLPVGNRPARAALAADERAFWAVTLSVAWSLGITLALAALEAYRFGRLVAVTVVACLLLAAMGNRRLRYSPVAAPWRVSALVPAAFVAFGLWAYFPPAEYVMGGKDPGTYMNEGIQLAQRGSLVIHDPTVAAVPAATRDLFFPSHNSKAYYSTRFMGFFVDDPRAGTVIGQFPQLYPASIAVGYGLNGLSGARQAVGGWAMLGALAVFFLGTRLFGRPAAAAGTALLVTTVVQLWFARYPNAEMATQALAFGAVLAFARAQVDGQRFFAPVAGALLALLLFARIDAALAVAGIAAAIVIGWTRRRSPGWGFWAAFLPGALLAGVYYGRVMTGYLLVPTLFVRQAVPVPLLAAVALLAVIAAWALSRVPRVSAVAQRAVPITVAVALFALGTYALLFREAAGKTAWHDAASLRMFVMYVGPYAMTLALAGLLVVIPRLFWRDPGFFLTAAAFATFFFYKIRIVPEHFWMTRRFVPVVLPAFALLVAALAWWLVAPDGLAGAVARRVGKSRDAREPSPGWRWAAIAGMLVVLAPVFAWCGAQSLRILRHVEYAGLIPRLEQLASRFDERDLVLVESRNASDLHVLALPLAYIYAKPVLVLNSPRPEQAMISAFIADARTKYREVFFLGSGGTDLLTRKIGVEPVGSDRFQIPEYDSPVNAYPSGVKRKEFDYGIYRFVDVSALAREPVIAVGDRDDLQVVRFHAKEKDPQGGRTYRWTRDVSYVSLLNVTAETRTIALWMANGRRPEKAGPAIVEVSLDEHPLGAVNVGAEARAYDFAVPPELAAAAAASDAPARLRLRCSTWSPRKLLGAPDDRELGVMLSRVEVK